MEKPKPQIMVFELSKTTSNAINCAPYNDLARMWLETVAPEFGELKDFRQISQHFRLDVPINFKAEEVIEYLRWTWLEALVEEGSKEARDDRS